jgi:hypothetical protein
MTPQERAEKVVYEFRGLPGVNIGALLDLSVAVAAAVSDAVAAERERSARAVEDAATASKVGPDHTLTWHAACATIARIIREGGQ